MDSFLTDRGRPDGPKGRRCAERASERHRAGTGRPRGRIRRVRDRWPCPEAEHRAAVERSVSGRTLRGIESPGCSFPRASGGRRPRRTRRPSGTTRIERRPRADEGTAERDARRERRTAEARGRTTAIVGRGPRIVDGRDRAVAGENGREKGRGVRSASGRERDGVDGHARRVRRRRGLRLLGRRLLLRFRRRFLLLLRRRR